MDAARPTVLVADDEPAVREALAEALVEAGFAVVTAADGLTAVALAKQQPIAVAVLDLRMPGLDGMATLEALKELDPDTEAVIATAHMTVEAAVACMKRGAHDIIEKPYELHELLRVVQGAVERRRLRLQVRESSARIREVEAHNAQLRVLQEIAAIGLQAVDVQSALEAILDRIMAVGPFDVGSIRLLDLAGERLELGVHRGYRNPDSIHLIEGMGAAHGIGAGSRPLATPGGSLVVDDVASSGDVDVLAREGVRTFASVLVSVEDEVLGLMEIGNRTPQSLAPSQVRLLEAIASQVGLVVQKVRVYDKARRLAAILEATPDLVSVMDRDGRRLYVNRAGRAMLGFGEDASVFGTTAVTNRPAWAQMLMSEQAFPAVRRHGVWSGETAYLAADGREVPVSEVLLSHRGRNGEIEFYSTIARDLTEWRRLEAQLRQAQKFEAIGQLAGGIAHDFNNILTVINGQCDLVLEQLPADNGLRPDIEEIRQAGNRARALTRQLLAFGRRQILQPRILDLNTVVADLERMLRRVIGEDIELVTRLATGLWRVKADPGALEQVLMNLAVNARDAMPRGGSLVIETANVELDEAYARQHVAVQPGPYVRLAVSDTGIGMDAATQARVFDPFFTTKAPGKGTGLGLAMVYGIVKQSGGNIWVYSEPGRGTTLKIYLPQAVAAEDAARGSAPVARAPGGSETILLVEDDDSVRALARRLLEHHGYTVLEARSVGDALKVVERRFERIDLLLTDLVLPGRSGPELATELAARRPGVPVLYMSGYTDDATHRQKLLEPGTPFLSKPFTGEELARKVRHLLDAGVAETGNANG